MNLLTKQEALSALYDIWDTDIRMETEELISCAGRTLAEDIYAQYSIPVVRASAMDGIAVKSAAFYDEDGRFRVPDTSEWAHGSDYVRADTGDDFPDEYDAVIAIEMVETSEDGGIELKLPESFTISDGTNVRPKASSIMKNEMLACRGQRLTAEIAALIAMSGRSSVKVVKKPVVAFIPTGSELVPAGSELKRGQNYDSNSYLAKMMLEEMGAEALLSPVVKDNRAELETALRDGLTRADIVVINGGSSKGEEDYITGLMSDMGTLVCHGAAAVPGRPIGIALIDGKPVVNLSGPPLAAYYGIDWCVRSLVCSLLGVSYPVKTRVTAVLKDELHTPPHMEMCVKLNVFRTERGYEAYSAAQHGSLAELMSANAVFISEIGREYYPAGSLIDVELRYEFAPDES